MWHTILTQLADKSHHKASIRGVRLRLQELQAKNQQVEKIKTKKLEKSWKNIDKTLHHQRFSYILEIIYIELINRYQNNLLIRHFGIDKIQKLTTKKYYWPIICSNINSNGLPFMFFSTFFSD